MFLLLSFICCFVGGYYCGCVEKDRLSLDCTKSGFHKIPSNLRHDLTTLYLNKNSISVIKRTDFNTYKQLEHLDLSDNNINLIEIDAFIGLYQLKSLYLSGNSLESLSFAIPSSLEIVDVSNNLLSSIKSYSFNNSKLTTIDLSSNNLYEAKFDRSTFEGIKTMSQISIDLSNNYLISLSNETFEPLLVKPLAKTNRYEKFKLNLNANNIHCNCLLKWVPYALSLPPKVSRPLSIDIQGQCNSPKNLQYTRLSQLDPSQLLCSPPSIVLPSKDTFSYVTWTEGNDVSIRCAASGDPDPVYSMIVNGKTTIAAASSQVGRYKLTDRGELFVQDVKLSDSGNITCIAENIAGISSHVIHVEIAANVIDVKKVAIALGIVIALLVFVIIIVVVICFYSFFKRSSFTSCLLRSFKRQRRSSSIPEDLQGYPMREHNHSDQHMFRITTNPSLMRQSNLHRDLDTSLTDLDYVSGQNLNEKPVNTDIHQAFLTGMRHSLDSKSKSRIKSPNSPYGEQRNFNKGHLSVYDLHSKQFGSSFTGMGAGRSLGNSEIPGNEGSSNEQVAMLAYARKSQTLPKLATINHMGPNTNLFGTDGCENGEVGNEAGQDAEHQMRNCVGDDKSLRSGMSKSQSNPVANTENQTLKNNPESSGNENNPSLPSSAPKSNHTSGVLGPNEGDELPDTTVLSRPSSTNSSNYSNNVQSQSQPYLSVKRRGTSMPTVPAKLYAISLYVDPPHFKNSQSLATSNNTNVVSPASTASET